MHLIVARNILVPLLEAVIGSADPKSAMPSLAHVLLATENVVGVPSLRASCTTLYQGTSGAVPCEVVGEGRVSIDAKALLARVKVMPVGPVEILETDGHVTVKASGAPRRFGMHGIPGAEFPDLPQPSPDAVWVELDAAVLGRLLAGTSYAMSTDQTRPHVNATLIEWQGTTLRCVTTDGHRLARAEATVPGQHRLTMLVGADAIHQMVKLLDGEVALGDRAGLVRLTTVAPHVFLEVGGRRFFAKLVDATFPPYTAVLDGATASAANVLRADRDNLVETLKAVQVSSEDGNIRLDMIAADAGGTLRAGNVTAAKANKGESIDEMAVAYTGPALRLGCQAKYLEQALQAMPEGDVVVKLGGELDPIVVEPSTPGAGESVVAVVMPARLSDEVAEPVAVKPAGAKTAVKAAAAVRA